MASGRVPAQRGVRVWTDGNGDGREKFRVVAYLEGVQGDTACRPCSVRELQPKGAKTNQEKRGRFLIFLGYSSRQVQVLLAKNCRRQTYYAQGGGRLWGAWGGRKRMLRGGRLPFRGMPQGLRRDAR